VIERAANGINGRVVEWEQREIQVGDSLDGYWEAKSKQARYREVVKNGRGCCVGVAQ
jgi:hypothetical protein